MKIMAQIKITKIVPEYTQGAIDVLRDTFFPNENVCKCVGTLDDSPTVNIESPYKCTKGSIELEALCLDVSKDQVSIVAVDQETNQVVGVSFNKIQVKLQAGEVSYFEKFGAAFFKDPSALAIIDYMVFVDSKLDVFELCNAECGLELMFLGVKNSYKGQGIGQRLVEETIRLASQYEGFPKPAFVSAIFSSRFSQKAGQRAGMEHLLEIPFSESEYKGRKFSEIIGPEHPVATLSIKKL